MATKSKKTNAPGGKPNTVKGRYKTYESLVKPRLAELQEMRANGLTISSIAANLGISPSTFYEWRNKHPEMLETLKEGDNVMRDNLVAQAQVSLMDKLKDRTVIETTRETSTDADGSIKVKETTKERFIAADTTAIIFTLRNRDADVWNAAENKLAEARINKIDADIAANAEGSDMQEAILTEFSRYGTNADTVREKEASNEDDSQT